MTNYILEFCNCVIFLLNVEYKDLTYKNDLSIITLNKIDTFKDLFQFIFEYHGIKYKNKILFKYILKTYNIFDIDFISSDIENLCFYYINIINSDHLFFDYIDIDKKINKEILSILFNKLYGVIEKLIFDINQCEKDIKIIDSTSNINFTFNDVNINSLQLFYNNLISTQTNMNLFEKRNILENIKQKKIRILLFSNLLLNLLSANANFNLSNDSNKLNNMSQNINNINKSSISKDYVIINTLK